MAIHVRRFAMRTVAGCVHALLDSPGASSSVSDTRSINFVGREGWGCPAPVPPPGVARVLVTAPRGPEARRGSAILPPTSCGRAT